MFPTGGLNGWSLTPGPAEDPPVFALPEPAEAVYFDPVETGGLGTALSKLSHHLGGTTVTPLTLDGALEARFLQPNVYGINLLDALVLGAPCSLVLTVYEDDGVTVAFEVGSDPDHPFPYLVDPNGYGEQEVDFAEGAASLGRVTVEVNDPARIPGDQDSGWMTDKLARVAGHRCRFIRYISTALGEQVIADGPAGMPSIHPSFSSFQWEIRDTRETERKVRLFEMSGDAATGLRSLIPDELIDGYGYDGPSNTYIQRPGLPLRGHANRPPGYPSPAAYVIISIPAVEFTGQVRRKLIWDEAYQAVLNGIGRVAHDNLEPNINFTFRWRAEGSSDEWKEVPGDVLAVSLETVESQVTSDARVVNKLYIEDRRLMPLDPLYDPATADLPAEDEIIEFFLMGPVPTSEHHPVIIDSRVVPGVDGPLNPTAALMLGRFELGSTVGGISAGTINLLAVPGNVEELRRQTVAVFERLGDESLTPDIFIPSRGLFSWREAGSADPWTDIELEPAAVGGSSLLAYLETPLRNTFRVFTLLQLAAPVVDVPADGQDIEFTVTYPPGSPELLDVTVGLTAGEFARNIYDGVYSPRGPLGELVPMRVRYDEAALLQMTDPIRLRLTEPVDDVRDFLERIVYAPTGWAPALDRDGAISPVSQVPPDSLAGLLAIDNAVTEPAPDWNAGQRIINILRFMYSRDFDSGAPDPPESTPLDPLDETRQGVVKSLPIIFEFRDEESIARHGDRVLELDGSAFTAIGKVPDAAEELNVQPQSSYRPRQRDPRRAPPVTSEPLVRTAVHVIPASGEVADEAGFQLAHLRDLHVRNRWRMGAPAFGVNVMRRELPLLRAGSWVVVDLSWLPDYVTGRRRLVGVGQVLAIGDLDCAWRHVLVEIVVPLEAES